MGKTSLTKNNKTNYLICTDAMGNKFKVTSCSENKKDFSTKVSIRREQTLLWHSFQYLSLLKYHQHFPVPKLSSTHNNFINSEELWEDEDYCSRPGLDCHHRLHYCRTSVCRTSRCWEFWRAFCATSESKFLPYRYFVPIKLGS